MVGSRRSGVKETVSEREIDVRERIVEASMEVFSHYGFFRIPVSLIASAYYLRIANH